MAHKCCQYELDLECPLDLLRKAFFTHDVRKLNFQLTGGPGGYSGIGALNRPPEMLYLDY